MIDELFSRMGIDDIEGKRLSLNSAMIAFVVFITGAVTTYLFHPNYSISEDYISTLGTGEYGWILNVGIVITGFLLLPIYFSLYYMLFDYTYNESRKYLTLGSIAGIISQVGLILVGIFVDRPGRDLHSIVAGIFFFGLMFSILFLTLMVRHIRPDTVFDRLDTLLIRIFGYCLVGLSAIMISINLFLFELTIDAVIQKIVVLSSFFFLGYFISQIRSSYIAAE